MLDELLAGEAVPVTVVDGAVSLNTNGFCFIYINDTCSFK